MTILVLALVIGVGVGAISNKRIRRVLRSWLGGAVDSVESAELILKQNIRDLEDQVPKLNEQLAGIVAQKNVADAELVKVKAQEADLIKKAKAALTANRRDIAQTYAVELEKLKPQIAEKEKRVQMSTAAVTQAQNVKRVFMTEKQKKIDDAKAALSHKHQAEWNEKLANTLANFQVGSIDQTQDEMIQRINEEAAKSEAKLQMALDDKQSGLALVEEDASKIQAEETLRQFELDMGLAAPTAAPSSEKTMGAQKQKVL